LANGLIDKALPDQLKSINSTLEKIGLNNLVTKEKSYIADAAAFIAPIAEPILVNTVQNMTSEDAQKIANGGKGAAQHILEKKQQLN
jgi:GTP:adenosylcobinamide-phosphate guanylyltransferase